MNGVHPVEREWLTTEEAEFTEIRKLPPLSPLTPW